MKRISYLFLPITFVLATGMSLNQKDKTFETIKMKVRDGVFYIDVPIRDKIGMIKFESYHGVGYNIMYTDSSEIYFSNDYYSCTQNTIHYQVNDTLLPDWRGRNDTIVFGKQSNGKYWKEIYEGGNWRGYLDISSDRKSLFDSSLITFRRTK